MHVSLTEAGDFLRDLAAAYAGRTVWSFIALDWYQRRQPKVSAVQHLVECRELLIGARVGADEGLRGLAAIAAELLGPDPRQIEDVCSAFLTRLDDEGIKRNISDDVFQELIDAGISRTGIKRLQVRRSVVGRSEDFGTTMGGVSMQAFVSYSHEGEDPKWMELVRRFANLLIDNGIQTDLDQFGPHLDRDWYAWSEARMQLADVLICLASPDYKNKWIATKGSGAANEGRLAKRLFDKGKHLCFVILPGRSHDDIPDGIAALQHFPVPTMDAAGIEDLARELTGQPRHVANPLGPRRSLPPVP